MSSLTKSKKKMKELLKNDNNFTIVDPVSLRPILCSVGNISTRNIKKPTSKK